MGAEGWMLDPVVPARGLLLRYHYDGESMTYYVQFKGDGVWTSIIRIRSEGQRWTGNRDEAIEVVNNMRLCMSTRKFRIRPS
jgi:hypothetical protein